MSYGKISKKQSEILEYIKNEILNRGFPPSVREVRQINHLDQDTIYAGSYLCIPYYSSEYK